ncbi:hypothetical protein Plav_0668 [Parvibaculum lavamentivorans DS-1]|uniref:Uncharacterized protein n=1 Tax=Parvibaculum lavamentivorans (strain DS-1 / DSM 13023 / NCIMB 13966) TaxID=402881 RepID=A7HQV8_PARL1|nr:hypothetical protein Plav_0668 [Parvibaculum lavamentivorans DS-1]
MRGEKGREREFHPSRPGSAGRADSPVYCGKTSQRAALVVASGADVTILPVRVVRPDNAPRATDMRAPCPETHNWGCRRPETTIEAAAELAAACGLWFLTAIFAARRYGSRARPGLDRIYPDVELTSWG